MLKIMPASIITTRGLRGPSSSALRRTPASSVASAGNWLRSVTASPIIALASMFWHSADAASSATARRACRTALSSTALAAG
jgi:hypothetical protein